MKIVLLALYRNTEFMELELSFFLISIGERQRSLFSFYREGNRFLLDVLFLRLVNTIDFKTD